MPRGESVQLWLAIVVRFGAVLWRRHGAPADDDALSRLVEAAEIRCLAQELSPLATLVGFMSSLAFGPMHGSRQIF